MPEFWLRQRFAPYAVAMFVTAAAACGCNLWQKDSPDPSKLPIARMAADSVVLEVAVLRLPEDPEYVPEVASEKPAEPSESDDRHFQFFGSMARRVEVAETAFWRQVDEQHLPVELRRRLADNGIRAGVVGALPLEWVRQLVSPPSPTAKKDGAVDVETLIDPQQSMQRLQCRAGRRGTIITHPEREQLDCLGIFDGVVRGRSYEKARCEIAIRAWPQGDGRVKIEAIPEIRHGPLKQRWVGSDGAFHVDSSQDAVVFQELKIEATLAPGQSLAIAADRQPRGVGKTFLAEGSADAPGSRKIVLIRLAQTQYDDLFSPAAAK